jgi:Ca2+/H+ antiporter
MIAENRRSVNIFYGFQIQTCVIIAPVILFFMRAREKIITEVRKIIWISIRN